MRGKLLAFRPAICFRLNRMLARLSALVGSGSALPFEFIEDEKNDIDGVIRVENSHWTRSRGIMKADGSKVSVFRISAVDRDDARLRAARNGIKRLRTVSTTIEITACRGRRRTRHKDCV